MELAFLSSLVVIFGVSAVVVFMLHRVEVPSIVGFLVAGVIIGPYGSGLVRDVHAVEMLAEVGVILLLFTIGIEISMSKLFRMKKAVLGGGTMQVLLTIGLTAGVAYPFMGNLRQAAFAGFLMALSSTAIVLKMLADRGETDTPHGRAITGILIFQDLCIVPLMLLIPVLSGEALDLVDLGVKMAKAGLILAAVLIAARWAVPAFLQQVVHTRSRELFITTIILLCLGTALMTSWLGLSLALGAFLAGLIISESEYSHQATSDILPFKESFMGLFFVSVGMLLNVGDAAASWPQIMAAVTGIFLIKCITGVLSVLVTGGVLRTAVLSGLGLSQIGEFSFVLALAGKSSGLISGELYQVFLSSSVITMAVTPFIMKGAPSASAWLTSRHLVQRASRLRMIAEREGFPKKRQNHIIIVGFGLNGKNLARVLKKADLPYVVLEMNSDTVLDMKKKGEAIYYGDGTSSEILHKMGIGKAKLLVVAISDPVSTRRIVAIARHENPDLHIIVRTRYIIEVDDLQKLGANEVIPEEFETSVEIFSRVLHYYHVPRNVIADSIEDIRKDSYSVLRTVKLPVKRLSDQHTFLKDMETETYLINESSPVAGHSISDTQLRKETGATLIAVQRGKDIYHNPSADYVLKEGDILLLIGHRKDLHRAMTYLDSDIFVVSKYHR